MIGFWEDPKFVYVEEEIDSNHDSVLIRNEIINQLF